MILINAAAALSLLAPVVFCDSFRYEPRGKRDPFVSLVGSDKPSIARLEDVTSIEDVKLEGIVMGGAGKKAAILNGQFAKENEVFGDVVIRKIGKKQVTISIGPMEYNINLSDQQGGAARE